MDNFRLQRFVDAQDGGHTYEEVVRGLRLGRKSTHWMWFVFPQIAGLGRSEQARRFAISGLAEAKGYLAHPVLGPRLRECSRLLVQLPTRDAISVLGHTDATKLRSSMTLFAEAAPHERVFRDVLDLFFAGEADLATTTLLATTA